MGRRRRKSASDEDVELNLAAMLDMAFQLLTFFILTFNPPPIEGQISLRLPPPKPIDDPSAKQRAGSDTSNTNPVQGVKTLRINAFADRGGGMSMSVGEDEVQTIPALDAKLRGIFGDPSVPFEQVIIQVSSELRYEQLMRVVEICAKQRLPDGKPLSKLSFVEVPSGGAPP